MAVLTSEVGEHADPVAGSHMVRGSLAMLISSAITGLGGFVFWLLAARHGSADDVGAASALFQTVLLVNFATSLGLPIVIARFGTGDSARARTLFATSIALQATTSFIVTIVAAGFATGGDLTAPLRGVPAGLGPLVFAFLAVGAALATLVEVRLMALRAWGWVIARAAFAAVIRLPLVVFTPLDDRSLWLLILAVGAPAVTGWIGVAALLRQPPRTVRPAVIDRRTGRFALTNWMGLVATIGPAFAIPVMVAARVDNETHASFSIAWSIALLVFQVPHLIASVLLSESSRTGADGRNTLIALGTGLAVTGAATAVAFAGAGMIPVLYGSDFDDASGLLPIVMAATIGWAVTSTNLAVCRVREDNARTVAISSFFGIVTMSASAAGVILGNARGAAVGWLLANLVAAAASTMMTATRRAHRRSIAPVTAPA